MILEHSKDPVSAKWNHNNNCWNVGEQVKYRWLTTKNQPASEYFYDITDALNWIIKHDEETSLCQK